MLKNGNRSYQEASRAIQNNLQKHIESDKFQWSDSDEEASDEDNTEQLQRLVQGYENTTARGSAEEKEFVKSVLDGIKNALCTSSCLICISSVKKNDAIWNCQNCYNSFHLDCIKKWAKDSIFQQKNLIEENPSKTEKDIRWTCPKCRHEYLPNNIPRDYFCYCKKVRDPKFDAWNTPHSCGELCNLPLAGDCGHRCSLLCHPGPCPPCPQTVSVSCHCTRSKPSVRRCFNQKWSCGGTCSSRLACGVHTCKETCHDGPCPPCTKTSVQSCECGKAKQPRECASPGYKCGERCGQLLSCQHHSCEVICHSGPCPPCPLSLDRACPCGKSSYKLKCTEATPTCGDTCGKLLGCGAHNCAERCHRGSCPSCLQMRVKSCRCGAKKKEMQCGRNFTCDIKCKKLRDCFRHPCNKKCCIECQPCEQPCGKTLNCKNHKCTSRCHSGSCYPCDLYQKVSCNCGATSVSVPCGREKTMKPPRCRKECEAPSKCHHPGSDNRHNCHPGPCPPCKQTCHKSLPCGHTCAAPCHENVKVRVEDKNRPAGPWEARGPQWTITALPCPPCEAPVEVTCLGGHETAAWPCHSAKPASCGRRCGRELPCQNCVCARDCHRVRGAEDGVKAGTNCKKCELECLKPRPKGCSHACSIGKCHPGECPECVINIKTKCHCGLTNIFVKCGQYLSGSQEEQDALLCCKDQCPKLMECGHRCPKICHKGACSQPAECKKKVKITCKCKRKKEEFKCFQAFGKDSLVKCDSECKVDGKSETKPECVNNLETEEQRRNRKEAELFERQMHGGKKKRRNRSEHIYEEKSSILTKRTALMGSMFVLLISIGLIVAFS